MCYYKLRWSRTFPVVISATVGLSALVAYIVKISMDYAKLKTDFENNRKRDEETRAENDKKFSELYNSRNRTNDTLVELSTTLKMVATNIEQQFNSLDKKIDELKAEHRKGCTKDC